MLSAWLQSSGCRRPPPSQEDSQEADQPPSHVFLNGGKAYVPEASRDAFHEAYARDVLSGTPLYVVERAGTTYRMFADLDIYLEATQLPTTDLPTLVDYALSCFPIHGAGEEVSVCTRGSHGGKTGAHLVWKDLCVNDANAKRLLDAWVSALHPRPAWEATLDASVYRRNGLRMPWSRKRDDATGAGMYIPTHVWTHEKGLAPWPNALDTKSTISQAIARCSIRCALASSTLTSTSTLTTTLESKSKVRHQQLQHHNHPHPPPPPLPQRALRCMGMDENTPIRIIHSNNPSGGRCMLFSCIPPSRECRIANRQHKSNHVYYQLLWDDERNEWHLRQRCHSANCADKHYSFGFILPVGHASSVQADATLQKTIAKSADRWMARLNLV